MTDFSGSVDVCSDSGARKERLVPLISDDNTRGCECGVFHRLASFCSFSLLHQNVSLVLLASTLFRSARLPIRNCFIDKGVAFQYDSGCFNRFLT